MPHPSEALLLAYADDDLGVPERAQVVTHVERCAVCRHALRDVREAMAAVRVEAAIIDAGEPVAWREAVRPPVRPLRPAPNREGTQATPHVAETHARREAQPPRSSRAASIVPLQWAAALLLFAAGGAAAMVAPRWRALFGGTAVVEGQPATRGPSPDAASALATAEVRLSAAAVSVAPSDGSVTVALRPQDEAFAGHLVVRTSARADVQVTVSTPARSTMVPRFSSSEGRLDVSLAASGTRVEVEVPATLRDAQVLMGGRAMVTVRGGVVFPREAASVGVALGAAR